jgi:hypothetical protein
MPHAIRRVGYYHLAVDNRPGEGARILGVLRDAGVDLLAFHAFPRAGRVQFDFVASDESRLTAAARDAKLQLSGRKTAFLAQSDDHRGAAADLLGRLAQAGINVTAMDAVSTGDRYGALFWVDDADVERAAKAVGAH